MNKEKILKVLEFFTNEKPFPLLSKLVTQTIEDEEGNLIEKEELTTYGPSFVGILFVCYTAIVLLTIGHKRGN